MTGSMRGLVSFISRIKNCTNDLDEEKRVDQELAKIRLKFSNKGLSGYRKKKCVWKLIYIHMLGYAVDMGLTESSHLINSEKFSEKITGYIATSIFFNDSNSSQLDVAVNSIKGDLAGGALHVKTVVLAALTNCPVKPFIERLASFISDMAFNEGYGTAAIQKKAIACLNAFLKKDPSIFQEKWAGQLRSLLFSSNVAIVLAAAAFLSTCISIKGAAPFVNEVNTIVEVLSKLVDQSGTYSLEYAYYSTLCPWLQVRLLQLLQLFPAPEKPETVKLIQTVLNHVVTRVEVGSNINKNNADHAVLFEAINLTLHYRSAAGPGLRKDVLTILNKYIGVREANVRYLALESMAKLSGSPETTALIMAQKNTILISLRDIDTSIRRRALDVLFALCDKQTAVEIVNDLLEYLNEKDVQMKEELVLKIALLAEKFGESIQWYIDVIIKMMEAAGNYVGNDVWYRIAQVVTGFEGNEVNTETQKYAATKIIAALNTAHAYEPLVRLGAYIMGEYGDLIIEDSENPASKARQKQYDLLMRHYNSCSPEGRCMLLSTFVKMAGRSPQIKEQVVKMLDGCKVHWDLDIQQRAVEYLTFLGSKTFEEKKGDVLDKAPPFPESFLYNNVILRSLQRLQKKKARHAGIIEEGAEKEETLEMAAVAKDEPLPAKKAPEVTEAAKSEPKPAPASAQLLDIDLGGTEKSAPIPTNLGTDIGAAFGSGFGSGFGAGLGAGIGTGFGAAGAANIFSESAPEPAIKKHPMYTKYRGKFAKEVSIDPEKVKELALPYSNVVHFKKLISSNRAKEGIIYEDGTLLVKLKSEYNSFLARHLVQFSGRKSALESLTVDVDCPKGLEVQCSKVKYPSGGSAEGPIVMVQMMFSEPFATPPVLKVSYSTPSTGSAKAEFALPVMITRFVEGKELTLEAADSEWKELGMSPNCVDAIVKNPAPAQVPHVQVLLKVAQLLHECFGMYVVPPADEAHFNSIYAAGVLALKSSEQTKFPTTAAEVQAPKTGVLMVEAEFYPEMGTNEFRLSVRSQADLSVAEPLLALFKLFINS